MYKYAALFSNGRLRKLNEILINSKCERHMIKVENICYNKHFCIKLLGYNLVPQNLIVKWEDRKLMTILVPASSSLGSNRANFKIFFFVCKIITKPMCCFIKNDAAGKRAAKNMRPINFLLLSLLIQMLFLRSSYIDLAGCYAMLLC